MNTAKHSQNNVENSKWLPSSRASSAAAFQFVDARFLDMEKQFPTTPELWKLPTIATSSNPVFVSPPCPPRDMDPMDSPFTAQEHVQSGPSSTPIRRGSSHSDENKTPTNSRLPRLQETTPIVPTPKANPLIVPQEWRPAMMPLSSTSTLQPLHESQSSNVHPLALPAFNFPGRQYSNSRAAANSHDLTFDSSMHNRHMSLPTFAEPQRMTLPIFQTPQSPFTSPPKYSGATMENGCIVINNGLDYQLRSPTDLLEAMQAYPIETYSNIEALGRDNINFKQELVNLRNEMARRMDENRVANMKHGQDMVATLDQFFEASSSKVVPLFACVDRLQEEICRLNRGGKMMHGAWFSDEEYSAAVQTITAGETSWGILSANKLAAQQSLGDYTNGNQEGHDMKGKGKAKEGTGEEIGKEKPRWNPKAAAFTPNVAGSISGNSDATEIFSPIPSSHQNASPPPALPATTTCPTTPTYASILHPAPGPSPTPNSLIGPSNLSLHPQIAAKSSLPIIPGYWKGKGKGRGKGRYPRKRPTGSPSAAASSSNTPSKDFLQSSTNPTPTPTSASTPVIPSQPTQTTQTMPDSMLTLIASKLPSYIRTICPFSLTGLETCPIQCQMRKLCALYNDENIIPDAFHNQLTGLFSARGYEQGCEDEDNQGEESPTPKGKGKETLIVGERKEKDTPKTVENTQSWHTPRKGKNKNGLSGVKGTDTGKKSGRKEPFCGNRTCTGIHELATCLYEVSEESGSSQSSSTFLSSTSASGAATSGEMGVETSEGEKDAKSPTQSKCRKTSKKHYRKRVHQKSCDPEDWKNREVVAGLREAHREGRYM